MKFDWYAVTLPEFNSSKALRMLHAGLGGEVKDRRKGWNGYENSWEIHGPEGIRCTFASGGINKFPHAYASGERTEPFVEFVRTHWPENHGVSRMDVAQDFDSPGAFEKLLAPCLEVVDRLKLKAQRNGDWYRDGGPDGRTQYIGSLKSPAFARFYEKGKEQRAQHPGIAPSISLDWVRLEAQIRPSKENRRFAATVSPTDAWGFSMTTQAVLKACMDIDVVRISSGRHDISVHQKTMNHLVYQYERAILKESTLLGGPAELGPGLLARISYQQKLRRNH